MNRHIFWAGRVYDSREHCVIRHNSEGFVIQSTIVGSYEQKVYTIMYHIQTNAHWECLDFTVDSQINDSQMRRSWHRENKHWKNESGDILPEFDDCLDLDISLTPFTNTLPINRLHLNDGEKRQIKVIYFDILDVQVKPARQYYTCIDQSSYNFQTDDSDFEATIAVDDDGIVMDYPGLFVAVNF
jgi:hypothetical protein